MKMINDMAADQENPTRPRIVIRNLNELRQFVSSREVVHGTGEAVLIRVEDMMGGQLPACYRQFLGTMCKPTGQWMAGATLYQGTPDLLAAKAVTALRKHGGPELSNSSFIFWMVDDYKMAFFENWNVPDPSVHYYEAGRGQTMFEIVTTTLTAFMVQQTAYAFQDVEIVYEPES